MWQGKPNPAEDVLSCGKLQLQSCRGQAPHGSPPPWAGQAQAGVGEASGTAPNPAIGLGWGLPAAPCHSRTIAGHMAGRRDSIPHLRNFIEETVAEILILNS